jgi:hypothetical protein
MSAIHSGSITATEDDQALFRQYRSRILDDPTARVRVILGTGEEVDLPASALQALKQIVAGLAEGVPLTIVPYDRDLTAEEAAIVLGVSPEYVSQLRERGRIPFQQGAAGETMRLSDVLRHAAETRAALRELIQLSEEYGLYDEEDAAGDAPRGA